MANEKYQCLMELSTNCKKASGLRGDSFYYANISKNMNKQKKMPVCKECIQEYLRDYMKFDKEKAIEQAMILFPFLDVAYVHDVFMNTEDVGVYFRTINMNYRDNLAWKDSIFPDDDSLEDLIEIDDEIRDEWVERWGEGFAITDYLFLENEFRRLCDAFELDDYGKEIIFKQIAYTQLDLLYATKNKLPKDKLVKQLQDLMGTASLQPKQRDLAKQNNQTLGVSIKELEEDDPIIAIEQFRDINKIEECFKEHFVKHFSRMLEFTK